MLPPNGCLGNFKWAPLGNFALLIASHPGYAHVGSPLLLILETVRMGRTFKKKSNMNFLLQKEDGKPFLDCVSLRVFYILEGAGRCYLLILLLHRLTFGTLATAVLSHR